MAADCTRHHPADEVIGACGLQDGSQLRLEQVDRTMPGQPLVRPDKPGGDRPAVELMAQSARTRRGAGRSDMSLGSN
ncbi:MAG TPA: hypothetical protein VGP93_17130 [Polyangiaceae bacterium]|nr:hypothetical protein [Polyangiaceae bacterium]